MRRHIARSSSQIAVASLFSRSHSAAPSPGACAATRRMRSSAHRKLIAVGRAAARGAASSSTRARKRSRGAPLSSRSPATSPMAAAIPMSGAPRTCSVRIASAIAAALSRSRSMWASGRAPSSTLRTAPLPVQGMAWTRSGAVRIVDQRALPEAHIERDLESAAAMAEAIRTLQVRGAPLIGIAAAMGLVAGLRDERGAPRERFLARVAELAAPLAAARPTAVNLRWALDRMRRVAAQAPGEGAALWDRLKSEATAIWEEDRAMCRSIGEAGLPLVPDGAAVLTHCNAGALATGGIGTALAPVYLAHEAGRRVHVYVDETRPVLQGARLTAWELAHAGIRCTVIADAAAGALMRQAEVDLALVGADRIAANGDFANKIGTYALAVLALHHGVPFYCAAPSTTIDATLADGDGIPIEQRPVEEVKTLAGRPIAPAAAGALNPAFDVTPARYVTGYLMERGMVKPPFGADP